MRQFGIASSQLFSGRDPGSPLTCSAAFARPGMPTEFVAAFRDFYGPTMNAFEAAAKNGKADDLQRELESLVCSAECEYQIGRYLHSRHLSACHG